MVTLDKTIVKNGETLKIDKLDYCLAGDIIVENGGVLIFENTSLCWNENYAIISEGLVIASNAAFRTQDYSAASGGIILIGNGAAGSEFINCNFDYSAGIKSEKYRAMVSTDVLNGEETYGGAAAVFDVTGGTVNFSKCVFRNCQASAGGAVYISNSSVRLGGVVFESCEGYNYNGGAVYAENSDDLKLIHCNFLNCKAYEGGGGLYSYSNSIITDSCIFSECSAGEGGGLYLSNSPEKKIEFQKCQFYNCKSENEGGAIYLDKCHNNILKDIKFNDCTAGTCGGGIFTTAVPKLESCKFSGCCAKFSGGAIELAYPENSGYKNSGTSILNDNKNEHTAGLQLSDSEFNRCQPDNVHDNLNKKSNKENSQTDIYGERQIQPGYSINYSNDNINPAPNDKDKNMNRNSKNNQPDTAEANISADIIHHNKTKSDIGKLIYENFLLKNKKNTIEQYRDVLFISIIIIVSFFFTMSAHYIESTFYPRGPMFSAAGIAAFAAGIYPGYKIASEIRKNIFISVLWACAAVYFMTDIDIHDNYSILTLVYSSIVIFGGYLIMKLINNRAAENK